jgi:hypothetical protein
MMCRVGPAAGAWRFSAICGLLKAFSVWIAALMGIANEERPPKKRMLELDHFTGPPNDFDELARKYDAFWKNTP